MARKPTQASPQVYELAIERYTPETLPMRRLLAYMNKLADLFGNDEHVHFKQVVQGSAVARVHVDWGGQQKVKARLHAASRDTGPIEAVKARTELNRMFRDDNTSAALRLKDGDNILDFPGRKTPLSEEAVVTEAGELRGIVARVGGKGDTIPVWLEVEPGDFRYCFASRDIVRGLAPLYDHEVKVFGVGRWKRDRDGEWQPEQFEIQSFLPIENGTGLVETVEAMRQVEGSGWNALDDPLAVLRTMREG